jgi:probable F420-dependent oxidoreductase
MAGDEQRRRLGSVGVRSWQIGEGDLGEAVDAVQELEELGYGAVWLTAAALLERGAALAAATRRIVLAGSVASIWQFDPHELGNAHHRLATAYPGRFVCGIGVSHAPIVASVVPEKTYRRPVSSMHRWLDALDATGLIPSDERVLAAIWPRMLGVARDRSLGSHPYLVPPAHTAAARAVLGPRALLAPAHVVIGERDADTARRIGRRHIAEPYATLPNYVDNWKRYGFEDAEFADGGSDRLIDALIAWGEPEQIAAGLRAHLDAGADHVAMHIVRADRSEFPRDEWRTLAAIFGSELLLPASGSEESRHA